MSVLSEEIILTQHRLRCNLVRSKYHTFIEQENGGKNKKKIKQKKIKK